MGNNRGGKRGRQNASKRSWGKKGASRIIAHIEEKQQSPYDE